MTNTTVLKPWLIPWLALLAAFPPMATDMYLPAMPELQHEWKITLADINLSLVVFFGWFSVALLIHGPLSDRFGRKPVLLFGVTVYIMASLACALAQGVDSLILWRSVQAIGAASAAVMALAMTKDLFNGAQREKILSYISMIMALAPILSPILGAYLFTFFNWQAIFVGQAILGLPALLGGISIKETNKLRDEVKIANILTNFRQLFANRQFRRFNYLQALSIMPMFGFIAASPSIYMEGFGVSEEVYSYLFALNAFALMLGAFVFSKVHNRINNKWILLVGVLGEFFGGLLLLVSFNFKVWISFAAPLFIITFCIGFTRAVMNNYALEAVQKQAGTASSLLNFTAFFGAMMAMQWVVLQRIGSPVWLLAGLILVVSIACLWLWWIATESMRFDLQRI